MAGARRASSEHPLSRPAVVVARRHHLQSPKSYKSPLSPPLLPPNLPPYVLCSAFNSLQAGSDELWSGSGLGWRCARERGRSAAAALPRRSTVHSLGPNHARERQPTPYARQLERCIRRDVPYPHLCQPQLGSRSAQPSRCAASAPVRVGRSGVPCHDPLAQVPSVALHVRILHPPSLLYGRVFFFIFLVTDAQCVNSGSTESGKSFVSKLVRDQLLRLSARSKSEKRLAGNLKHADVILGAFGHAKTKANADASRFSRYTELHYDPSGTATGARIFTFGLDKSRVIRLPREERTFHVFYQLVSGASHEERELFHLEDTLSYALFNSSRCYRLPGGPYSDDSLMMGSLRSAMLHIGFKPKHVSSIFAVLSAILNLGNLQFGDHNGFDATFEAAHLLNPYVLTQVAELLGVEEEALTQALTYRTRCIKKEVVTSLLNASSSAKQRDALVRDMYATLFAFIVETINHKIAPLETGTSVIASLDLPGFTSKEGHSLQGYFSLGFEDFNNNLMAETLFNWLTTRDFDDSSSLNAGMIQDGITLPAVIPPDNAPVVELLRGTVVGMAADYRPSGLLGVLDRAGARIRTGKLNEDDDPSLAADMDTFAYHTAYVSTQAMYASSGQRNHFGVRHYQGPCVYSVEGFLAADSDPFDAGFVTLLRGSSDPFVARLFAGPSLAIETHPLDDSVIVGAQVTSRPLRGITPLGDRPPQLNGEEDKPYLDSDKMYGVSRQLNATLTEMIHNLESANALWSVLCIRANEISQPNAFDAQLVKAQVASLHLTERIARKRVEYFQGMDPEEFCLRYSDFVIPIAAAAGAEDPRGKIQALGIANAWRDGADYAMGETKVWLSYTTWRTLEDRLRVTQGDQPTSAAITSSPMAMDDDLAEDELEDGEVEEDVDHHDAAEEYPPASRGLAMPAAPPDNPFAGGIPHDSRSSHSHHSQPPPNAWAGATGAGAWGQEAYGDLNPGLLGAPEKADDYKIKPLDAVEEDGEVSRVRRFWKMMVWGLTFWCPNFLIQTIGRISRPDVMFAWREKVAICALILFANGLILFYIIGVGMIVCPEYNKVWDTSQLSERGTSNQFWVAVAGKVYDLTKFYKGDHSNAPHYFSMTDDQKTDYFGGKDITLYFPVPLYVGCPGLVDDKMLELTYSVNSTQTIQEVPGQVIHKSGAMQDDKNIALAADDWYPNSFLPTMKKYYKGAFVYTKSEFKSQGSWRNWVSVDDKVYDLTDYIYSQSQAANASQWNWLNPNLVNLFRNQPGTDVTKDFKSTLNSITELERKQNMNCLDKVFYVGKRDPRQTPRCTVQNYILLSFSAVIMLIMLSKFLAALQLTPKRNPEQQDKFVVCQIPCYTEDEDSLRKTIDSIAGLKYDDKRKLIFVICDGMIVGSGNDQPTPRIVLDILGVDPRIDPEPLAFKSIAEGSKQLNFAKVYSGLYEFEGHVVPYIVTVKCGRPSERARPGNRGKRDTQILLMRWLNRVHFDAPMSPLELELTHQCKNVIGIDPAFYEYVLTVDADTKVREDSLNRLVAVTADDSKIIALCGETMLDNEQSSWWTMIQVYEYYISHHLAKAFESLFGSVTCLPGCFSIYRIRSADKGKPLFISSRVIDEYSENKIDTLHKKNLFALGEDRYLTTLLLKNFPTYKTKFTSDAKSQTSAPDRWGILLSQRRRWINSTVHNLAELTRMEEMCGFCLFSMRFVVFIDLIGTIILPSTVVYLIYMIYMAASKQSPIPYISIALIAATYGLQVIIFLLKRQWQYIGWMFVYLLAYPIWSFFLPIYSFWHMDDFSWGNTRVVVGEKGNKKIVAGTDDEPYHDSMIPLKRFSEYQQEVWERGSASSDPEVDSAMGGMGAGDSPFGNPLITGSMPSLPHGSMYKGSMYKGSRSQLGNDSLYKGGSIYSDEESEYDTGDYYQQTNVLLPSAHASRSNLSRPGPPRSHLGAGSQMSHGGMVPPMKGQQTPFASMYGMPMQGSMYGLNAPMPSMYGMPPPGSMYGMPAGSMLGGMGAGGSMMDIHTGMGTPHGAPDMMPQTSAVQPTQPSAAPAANPTNPFAAPAVPLPVRSTANPTDAEIVTAVQTYLAQQPSLMNVTKRSAREAVMAAFPNAPTIKDKKALINKAIDDTLRGQ